MTSISKISHSILLVFVAFNLPDLGAQESGGGKSYRFPGGEVEAGQTAFVTLNCNQCHTVADVMIEEPKGKRRLNLELAAESRFVKRYQDIITAVVNPQHVINEQYSAILSKPELNGSIKPFMPDLTSEMSARQLMDLVAFLDKAYQGALEGYKK